MSVFVAFGEEDAADAKDAADSVAEEVGFDEGVGF